MTGFEAFVIVWLAGIVGAAVVAEIVGRWRARVWERRTTTKIGAINRRWR